jgi:uncharacterized protein (TIGR02001 family)
LLKNFLIKAEQIKLFKFKNTCLINSLILTCLLLGPISLLAGEYKGDSSNEHKIQSPHTLSASVTLATEYLYRGVSRTNGDPAIQGSFDYAHSSGFYAGVWASSLEWNSGTNNAASLELDYYAGYTFDYYGLSYDIGYMYYMYTGQDVESSFSAPEYDYSEVYVSATKTFNMDYSPTASLGVAWSPDYSVGYDDSVYVNGSLSVTLPMGISPYFSAGWQDLATGKGATGLDYFHYAVGASADIGPITLDLSWNDTDNIVGNSNDYDGVVFSISSMF